MTAIRGCQEGKFTPQLTEIRCPKCGEDVEVFVFLRSEKAGQLAEDAKCDACGHVIPEGTPAESLR